jgi:hypothetical protein
LSEAASRKWSSGPIVVGRTIERACSKVRAQITIERAKRLSSDESSNNGTFTFD